MFYIAMASFCQAISLSGSRRASVCQHSWSMLQSVSSALSTNIPHASPKHSDSISAALEEFLRALQQHPDSLVKAFAQAFREHSADILTGMLVWSMKVYCATALLDPATRKPSNHIKMCKFAFECIWRVRVYLAAFFSLNFTFFLLGNVMCCFLDQFFCSSVFGVRVYLAPFECIWLPFECIRSGSSVFGGRRKHSNGFPDNSSVFGEMCECIWRIQVYSARECIRRGGASKKTYYLHDFREVRKTLFSKIENLRCARV